MVFISYIHLYYQLLHLQHFCHLLTGKVTNKMQEILHLYIYIYIPFS
jgi:hypothetical protein